MDLGDALLAEAHKYFNIHDVSQMMPQDLARDVRAGVLGTQHSRAVIAIGNCAVMQPFVNVCAPINMLINALVERKGCMRARIFVCGLLPRPGLDDVEKEIMKKCNKGIMKSVNALVRKKQFPAIYVNMPLWFLKRVQFEDGSMEIQPDTTYYQPGGAALNDVGLNHLFLLLAKRMELDDIDYSWAGVPLVQEVEGRQVLAEIPQMLEQDEPGQSSTSQDDTGKNGMGDKARRLRSLVRRNAKERKRRRKRSATVTHSSANDNRSDDAAKENVKTGMQMIMELGSDSECEVPLLVAIPRAG